MKHTITIVAMLLCGVANADPLPVTGLPFHSGTIPVGTEFYMLLSTNGAIDSTSDDIEVYDQFVNEQMAREGSRVARLGLEWRAVVSTPTVDARDHIGVSANDMVLSVNGHILAADGDDIWEDGLSFIVSPPIIGGENTEPTKATWTGTGPDGTAVLPLGSGVATTGLTTWLDWNDYQPDRWISNGTANSSEFHRVYAMSQRLVYRLPEPSNISLALVFLLSLYTLTRRKWNV